MKKYYLLVGPREIIGTQVENFIGLSLTLIEKHSVKSNLQQRTLYQSMEELPLYD